MTSSVQPNTVYCQKCGTPMGRQDRFCSRCGTDHSAAQQAASAAAIGPVSDRKRLVALLLCVLLGVFGAHRFYVGKIGTGVLWLFTFGLFTLGWLFDLILIIAGEFKDSDGRKVIVWSN